MSDTDEIVRPDWVPSNAVWVNGLWHVNGVKVYDVKRGGLLTHYERGELDKAQHAAEYERQRMLLREGLAPGQYRHGGLIYGRDAKVVGPDDQSWRPGHAEKREERITGIKQAAAAQQKAIDALAKATQRKLEADAAAFRSHNVEA